MCWALSRGVRAQLGAGTALVPANPETGPVPGSLSWVYPPDSPRGYRQQLQPTANCTHITGCHLGTASRSSSSVVTTLQFQILLVPAPRPAPGPEWPWGSLSPLGEPHRPWEHPSCTSCIPKSPVLSWLGVLTGKGGKGMLSVSKSEPIPRTWGTSWRGMDREQHPKHARPLLLHVLVHLYIQSGANPAGTETNRKTSAGPSRAGWELGLDPGGEQAGSPVWLAEREGNPPKQSLVPQPDTLPPV